MKSANKISNKIKIGNFVISKKNSCFIVAELSGNHGGKKQNVFKAIDLISKSGANAIKLQSYEPDTITINSKKNIFILMINQFGKVNIFINYINLHTHRFHGIKKFLNMLKRKVF